MPDANDVRAIRAAVDRFVNSDPQFKIHLAVEVMLDALTALGNKQQALEALAMVQTTAAKYDYFDTTEEAPDA